MDDLDPQNFAWLLQGISTTGPPTFCSRCIRMSPEVDIGLCPHCGKIGYCSLECQLQDWHLHRAACPLLKMAPDPLVYGPLPIVNALQNRPTNNEQLDAYTPRPFTRLVYGIWLHDRPREDVSHRHEVSDIAEPDSVYSENPNVLTAFRRFVESAAAQPILLPLYWDDHEMLLTEGMAVDTSPEN
ncbi:uncharacterized protein DNG_02095 [Cephalotrichum gorgonifer]|uniref:MYND-type domain-containing protein n=1 Tax=Cephalotrichum gorgonifer TaxID=2041049 RepID=A0AAE8SSS6_9PEZI|nr:uncharacterized protein DNG_02095 [Cephalotrichum gorgonifer]